jgi:sugar phosphate isomerase/epimerase
MCFATDRLNSRRQFLRMAGTLALGAAWTAAPDAHAQQGTLLRVGIFAATFPRSTPEAVLDAVQACGLKDVQWGMQCAGLTPMPDEIPGELADRIRRAAETRGIRIAGVQGVFNMCHPDPEERRAGLRRLRVLAGACRRMGTSIIGLCTGTRDRESMWRRHPDNDTPAAWREMLACVREAVDIARQADVVLAFEPEVNNVVDSAEKARRLLDEIRSPHLKVTFDGANLFHRGELPRMAQLLDDAFALLGKDIVAVHAKDLDHDGDAGHLPAGKGRLDYDRYLALLQASGFRGPLLLHGLNETQVPGCVAFLQQKLARLVCVPS